MIKEYFLNNLLKTKTYTANVLGVCFGFTMCFLVLITVLIAFITNNPLVYELVDKEIAIFKDVSLLVIGAILRGTASTDAK